MLVGDGKKKKAQDSGWKKITKTWGGKRKASTGLRIEEREIKPTGKLERAQATSCSLRQSRQWYGGFWRLQLSQKCKPIDHPTRHNFSSLGAARAQTRLICCHSKLARAIWCPRTREPDILRLGSTRNGFHQTEESTVGHLLCSSSNHPHAAKT